MLVVNPEKRFTIDQCLNHPWMTMTTPGVNDSTDGLVGGMQGLDVQRRGMRRERTFLSSINTVQVTQRPGGGPGKEPIKIFSKHPVKKAGGPSHRPKEPGPADHRAPGDFVEMGGKGDQQLFDYDGQSNYLTTTDVAAGAPQPGPADGDKGKGKSKDKGKGKANGH